MNTAPDETGNADAQPVGAAEPGTAPPEATSVDVAELTFEEAFRELEAAVTALERGELSLDDSLALYERGAALAERCAKKLVEAELRVRRLDPSGADAGEIGIPS